MEWMQNIYIYLSVVVVWASSMMVSMVVDFVVNNFVVVFSAIALILWGVSLWW